MKLVEILAHHLNEWPDHVAAMAQDRDGDVQNYRDTDHIFFEAGLACGSSRILAEYSLYGAELASDHSTAIITRADWEAERARIAMQEAADKIGEKLMKPKANKDGWIRHRGGKCPVDGDAQIDLKLRNGEIKCPASRPASEWNWRHSDCPAKSRQIMAWRPHKAEQVTAEQSLGVEMPDAKQDGPLQWRDRITEINRQMADLRAEKASLVVKLSEEGFTLIGEQPF